MDWAAWLGYLVQMCLMLLVQVEADIKCICTTYACKQQQVVTCTASHHCYVQYFAQTEDDVGNDVIRGCIDESQPLLCYNKRPTVIKEEPWPVLHCCKTEFCNRDVIPTAPPWLVKATEEKKKNQSHQQTEETDNQKLDYARQSKYEHKSELSVNPIYIGVPIAGACILLAIILFAIFLLRRNNQRHFRRNYALAANHKSALEPASDLKFCTNGHSNGQNNNMNGNCENKERTSATSESKLLMKV